MTNTCSCCGAILVREPCLPEGQGPEMTQEQITGMAAYPTAGTNTADFKAIWQPFIDSLTGKAP